MTRLNKLGVNVASLAIIVASSAGQWTTNVNVLHAAAALLALLNVFMHAMPDQEPPAA